ncbi:MAG: transcription factor S [Candidatus Nanohaloarchaea archaeon]
MEFCEECGGMLVSENDGEGVMKCRNCGQAHEVEEGDYRVTEEKEEDPMDRLNISEEDDESSTRPTTMKECPSCGGETEHEWWMEQTRASDEPPTRFYECTECGNVHKEYD